MRDAAALRRVLPDYDRIGALLAAHDAIALYLAAVDPDAGHARARARSCARAEMGEDPATGSAVGPLCRARGRAHGRRAARGRPGRRDGPAEPAAPALEGDRVRVGGDAVILAEGTVHLLDA